MTKISPNSPWHIRTLLLLGAICVASASPACSRDGKLKPEPVATKQSAIIPLESPTTVKDCRPNTREPKCPGQKLPDQCGTWAGVELQVLRPASSNPTPNVRDEHCLCDAIDFQIPVELPLTRGRSGPASWDKPALRFRTAAGSVECRYRGNDGMKFAFERCSDGSLPGQTKRSDWFELELDGHPHTSDTEVQLRLGEPDVVGGVVQEQIFYSDDPRIPGAALHVPRGAAPAFESFSLTALSQVPLGSTIPNANNPATSIGHAVDVHAASSDTFHFTPVPGAPCTRLELPYDQATLDSVAGANGEGTIQAQQLTTLTGITSGARVLTSAGPVTVDPALRTFSFCVEHLSFYVGTSVVYNANLVTASVESTGGGTLGPTDLMSGTPPVLNSGETYQLTIGFRRTGSGTPTAWTSGGSIYLVAVGVPVYNPLLPLPTVTALTAPTPWGTPVSTNVFAGGSISVGNVATFTLNITSPVVSEPLNFCLRYAPSPADPDDTSNSNGFFGHCFTWDVNDSGTNPVPIKEICDNQDNDSDGVKDNFTEPCYEGMPASSKGKGPCVGGTRTCTDGEWGDCNGDITPQPETCGNDIDDDCDGAVDEEGSTFFLDGDGDGFGTADISFEACDPPPSFVTTTGDCCDRDPEAHPGQTNRFNHPTRCPERGFDYDCDGEIEPLYPDVGAVQSGCPPGVTGGSTICTGCQRDGWATSVAACGATADLENCGFGPEPCSGTCAIFTNVWIVQATQTCR